MEEFLKIEVIFNYVSLDLRGKKESEIRWLIVNSLMRGDKLEIIADKRILDILKDICEDFMCKLSVNESREFYIVKISKGIEVPEDSVSLTESFVVPLKPEEAYEKIQNPSILILFIPQIKAVNKLGEYAYLVEIKWVISWNTPLYIYGSKLTENMYEVKYFAPFKSVILNVKFGFNYMITRAGTGSKVSMLEWYKGPFKPLALREIRMHLKKAKEVLPEKLTFY